MPPSPPFPPPAAPPEPGEMIHTRPSCPLVAPPPPPPPPPPKSPAPVMVVAPAPLLDIVPATLQAPIDRITMGVSCALVRTVVPAGTSNDENQCSPPSAHVPDGQEYPPSEPSPTNFNHSGVLAEKEVGVTESVVEPARPLSVALRVEVPAVTPVARPPAEIVATA